jgi:four helix bundle protein
METARTFRDIIVWQKARALTLLSYKISNIFPKSELFGLTSQLRRSSASVATNIVEGFRRRGIREQIHFYTIADASLEETKYHFLLARDLGYCQKTQYTEALLQCEEVGRLLTRWIQAQTKKLST